MFKDIDIPYQQLFDSEDYTSLPVEEKVKKLEGIVLDLQGTVLELEDAGSLAALRLGGQINELEQKVTAWQVVSGFLFIFLLSFWVYG